MLSFRDMNFPMKTTAFLLHSIFRSVVTLTLMFLVMLITFSAAKSFSATAKSTSVHAPVKKKRYVDGYYNCESRTNDGRETSFYDIGPSLEIAKENAAKACADAKGKQNCYPFTFCYPISGRVPYKCSVRVGNAEFDGFGVNWATAEESARMQCSLYFPFVACLNAVPQTCTHSTESTL